MARAKKNIHLRDVTWEGIAVPLYLNPNTEKFCAQVGDQSFIDADAKIVQQWIYDQLKDLYVPEWVPVIELVGRHNPYTEYRGQKDEARGSIDFDARRFWIAVWSDTSVKKAAWEIGWNQDLRRYPDEKERPDDNVLRTRHRVNFLEKKEGRTALVLPIRLNDKTYHNNTGYSTSSRAVIIPYEEITWQGIHEMLLSLGKIAERMDQLFMRNPAQVFSSFALGGGLSLQLEAGDLDEKQQ